jgi:transposase
VAYGHKGKGVLIHGLVDGNGRMLSACVTPANGDEKAQVEPLLDDVIVQTGRRGRPPKRIGRLAGDKNYDAKALRATLRRRGIEPQFPKRRRRSGKPHRGRPLQQTVPRYPIERAWAWLQRRFRRLVVRWERKTLFFNAFLQLAVCWQWVPLILAARQEVVG